LLYLSYALLGFGTWQARLVSAVFGTLAIGVLWGLASALFNRRVGMLSAVLLAVSQIGVQFSQEVRPYAVLLFLSLLTQWLFLQALRTRQTAKCCATVLAGTLLVYTHYYGVFTVLALFLYWITTYRRHPVPIWWWALGGLGGLVLMSPWIIGGMIAQIRYWAPHSLHDGAQPWFALKWSTPISTLNMFNNGKFASLLDSAPRWTFPVGAILYTVPALTALWDGARRATADDSDRRDALWFLLTTCLVPFAMVIALAIRGAAYDIRYVSFCAAPYYVLVAYGLLRIPGIGVRRAWVAAAIAYGALSLSSNYYIPYKENYRDALAFLAAGYQPEDVCVFEQGFVPFQWRVYHPGQPEPRRATLEELERNGSSGGRIWLIGYERTETSARRSRDAAARLGKSFVRLAERHYFWVSVSVYAPGGADRDRVRTPAPPGGGGR
jgi:4-amino-4-deoxy-L-arabinose transferase-like glycosyltransferase